MKKEIYTVFDKAAQVYSEPQMFVNEMTMLRACKNLMLDQNSQIAQNPEDFVMFHLGTYEDTTGMYELRSTPQVKIKFHELAGEIQDA